MRYNKRILVTGGAGSIGSELVRQLVKDNAVFILDMNETGTFDLYEELRQKGFQVDYRVGDIRNWDTVWNSFSDFKPQVVMHAAAYKHVSPMEKYPLEAISTNINGTWNVIDCANRYEVEKLVYVSTDKVVNAKCIMGATKRVGEIMAINAGYTAVRFGNVLGSRGSVIPIWQAQLDKGEPLTVTDSNMTRYFMTIPQACELVIEAYKQTKGGELMILDMGEPVNVLELAKKVLVESGKDVGIKMIGTRPGESLTEEIMTAEERGRAVKEGKFYIIK